MALSPGEGWLSDGRASGAGVVHVTMRVTQRMPWKGQVSICTGSEKESRSKRVFSRPVLLVLPALNPIWALANCDPQWCSAARVPHIPDQLRRPL